MPRFAANLSLLWPEIAAPYGRFSAARKAGFRAVEYLFPHELDAHRLQAALAATSLDLVLFDLDAGDFAGGERGIMCHPGREEQFLRSMRDAIALGGRLGTRRLNALTGIVPPGVPINQAWEVATANLRCAARLAEDAGVTLLVENINAVQTPRYLTSTPALAARLVETAESASVRLQFDLYHAAMAGLDPLTALREHFPLVGHIQVADMPGRHQPGTGQLPIQPFLKALDAMAYRGYVGLEFHPRGPTDSALRWLPVPRRGWA